MGSNLTSNYFEVTAVICFSIGFTMLFLNKNLIKKVIGFNFMDSSIFLFLASNGYITGRISPIITNGSVASTTMPVRTSPAGIVVSVSVSAFLLALTTRLYLRYHTLDLDEMIRLSRAEDD